MTVHKSSVLANGAAIAQVKEERARHASVVVRPRTRLSSNAEPAVAWSLSQMLKWPFPDVEVATLSQLQPGSGCILATPVSLPRNADALGTLYHVDVKSLMEKLDEPAPPPPPIAVFGG